MKIALCNEVIRELDFAAQCAFAAALGYDGIELAPFTVSERPHLLGMGERARLRRAAVDAGVAITGLHYLLVTPPGLSILSADPTVRGQTVEIMRQLVGLCADLGGKVLVHGSPAQRQVPLGEDPAAVWARARDTFAAVAPDAEAAGVIYCIEPLSRAQTRFVNTLAEAVRLVEAIGSRAIRTMIDTSSAGATEEAPVADLMDRWLPSGMVRHIHVNETNRRGPGQGENSFAPIFAALVRNGYTGVVAVEPFEYHPDGPSAAARAVGYIRGILEALAWRA